MKLNEELSETEDEEERENGLTTCSIGELGFQHNTHKVVVGYALTSKKKKSFLQPKLLGLARYY